MKKIFQFCAALVLMAAATGCYNDYDTPSPDKVVTDEDFAGMTRMTIREVKKLFTDEHGTISGTGTNDDWLTTKYVQIPNDKEYYIKGKIQSSDEEGNVYKSLYLVDETGAIEVKLGTGLYIDYPMGTFDRETGTIDTHYVYVKVSGLYVGNYRMMLSIGGGPTDSYNKVGEHKYYANSNIENQSEIKERVVLGEPTRLSVGEEILEVTDKNYREFFGEANEDKLGRMILLKEITCRYGTVEDNIYPSWMCTDIRPVESKEWYTWAVNDRFLSTASERYIHCNFYGSVLFSYVGLPSQTNTAGVFSVRTSGYSRFARRPVVRNGAKGDILAIMGIYAKSWTQSYLAYQCSVNRFEDIMFDEQDFLTQSDVEAITPADSYETAMSNTEYED